MHDRFDVVCPYCAVKVAIFSLNLTYRVHSSRTARCAANLGTSELRDARATAGSKFSRADGTD